MTINHNNRVQFSGTISSILQIPFINRQQEPVVFLICKRNITWLCAWYRIRDLSLRILTFGESCLKYSFSQRNLLHQGEFIPPKRELSTSRVRVGLGRVDSNFFFYINIWNERFQSTLWHFGKRIWKGHKCSFPEIISILYQVTLRNDAITLFHHVSPLYRGCAS